MVRATRHHTFFSVSFFHLITSRWTSLFPSCLWSRRIFPSLPGSRLTSIYRDVRSAILQLVNQWLNFTYSRSHAFRFGRKNTNPAMIDFRTSRCADYLLDHSGDAISSATSNLLIAQSTSPATSLLPPHVTVPASILTSMLSLGKRLLPLVYQPKADSRFLMPITSSVIIVGGRGAQEVLNAGGWGARRAGKGR